MRGGVAALVVALVGGGSVAVSWAPVGALEAQPPAGTASPATTFATATIGDGTAATTDRTASGGDRTASGGDRTASGGDRTASGGAAIVPASVAGVTALAPSTAVTGAGSAGPDGAGTGSGASADPADAGSIDVLRADAATVRAEIEATSARRVEAEAALTSARSASAAAAEDLAAAEDSERRARRRADELDAQVREAAIAAYVSSGHDAPLGIIAQSDARDASWEAKVLQYRAEQFDALLDRQQAARRELAAERRVKASTAATARSAERTADANVVALVDLEHTQQELATAIETRLDAALAEADALAAIDAAASAQLVADEQSLATAAGALSATPPPVGPPLTAPVTQPDRAATPTAPKTAPVTPPGPSPVTPPTTSPPSAPPATAVPVTVAPTPTTIPAGVAVDTVSVRGIVVARSIADALGGMLAAADAAGLTLGGSGYRDINVQISLRRQHCGSTDYDIWYRPASQCSPPTAIPGRSMHEKGLAVDLTCSGSLIRSRSDRCFVWLAANAASFGLYNLPSEPWHWSTNGN